jgi:ABC-type Na+ efflux pump permease subunit
MLKLDSLEKRVFSALSMSIIVVLVLYGYFVNETVFNIVSRKSLEAEIATLNSDIGALELNYIARKNNVTLEYAYAKGFKDVTSTTYVARTTDSAALTLNAR